jgi:hypothetical protein
MTYNKGGMTMLAVEFRDYFLIWQFLKSNNLELPCSLKCSTDGGTWLDQSKNIKFYTAENDYKIYIHRKFFMVNKIRVRLPIETIKIEQLAWDADIVGQTEEEPILKNGRQWEGVALFGVILLTRIK